MDNREAVNWLANVLADIGKAEHSDLWHYEQALTEIKDMLESAQPEQRYTKKELEIFKHGISISLLSKRSSQHWFYDEETAKEIELLERLYKKVEDDMKGEQNDGARDR